MITLPTTAIQITSVGGVAVDTATIAVVDETVTRFNHPFITMRVPVGQLAAGIFTPSPYATGQTLSLDLAAGTYWLGSNPPSTIPALLLVQVLTVVKAYRNGLESLANQAGAAPGVITAW